VFLLFFPFALVAGQYQVWHPRRLPWLFPLANLAIVSIPSVAIAATAAKRFRDAHPFSWPVSWREWTSGFIYGAIGATFVASIVNTACLVGVGAFLVDRFGSGEIFPLEDSLLTLPRGWGLFYDLTSLSVVPPLNEEFWKGMLVAFFFFRRGGVARCFLWGVVAGSGFNLLETFLNSLSVISPDRLTAQTLGDQWWLFATARAGTGAVHALASGLSALGFYGLFRRRGRYLAGYPAGVLVHATWNFLNYALAGDQLLSTAGPDSTALDVLSIAGMAGLFAACLALLWVLSGRLRDEAPAPIYVALGMLPATASQRGNRGTRTEAV